MEFSNIEGIRIVKHRIVRALRGVVGVSEVKADNQFVFAGRTLVPAYHRISF